MIKRKIRTSDKRRRAYTIDSFADAHEIGRTTVYAEIGSKRLIARKVGGRTIITVEDAADWRRNLPTLDPE